MKTGGPEGPLGRTRFEFTLGIGYIPYAILAETLLVEFEETNGPFWDGSEGKESCLYDSHDLSARLSLDAARSDLELNWSTWLRL